MERDKIDAEYKELMSLINGYKEIINNESVLLNLIKEEILTLKEQYADERKVKLPNMKVMYGWRI